LAFCLSRLSYALVLFCSLKVRKPRQAAPEATYAALQKSQREAEEKRKADDWVRETQPALVLRRRTVIDTAGLANRRDVPQFPDVSFGDSRLPDVSF